MFCVRIRSTYRDFPGGPVVKSSPSNAGGAGSILSQGASIPHPCGQKTKQTKKPHKTEAIL